MSSASVGLLMRAGAYPAPVLLDGELLLCGLRGALRPKAAAEPNFLVAGDRVDVARTGSATGIITARRERTSCFARGAVTARQTRRREEQVLAANLDLVLIVQAAYWPDFRPARADRYLLAAERGKVEPAVVVNKVDTLAAEAREACRTALLPVAAMGVPVLLTSAASGEGLDALRRLAAGRVSAFVGSSGVGKSSLIHALDPSLERRTQAIRERLAKGRHTTTAAEVLPFVDGGFLVDTPGLRAFGLGGGGLEELLITFPDVADLAAACRFRDCRHEQEPDCAVKDAAAAGDLAAGRFDSYRKLRRELAR